MVFKDIDIRELFKLMKEHDVSDLSLRDGKIAVEIKRGNWANGIQAVNGQASDALNSSTALKDEPIQRKNNTQEDVDTESSPVEEMDENLHIIKAPLVGTFYRAPSPESAPFVEVGDNIKKGDVICIVEAMKSMNEIQSDTDGVVREICLENAQLVEFEQNLFKIET